MFVPEPARAPAAKRIALRVEVRSCRGTLEGVPRLAEILRKHAARATFLFALGTDQTGRWLAR